MHSLEEITESLINDRDTLVENLTTMGVEDLTGEETFTELAAAVLTIPSLEVQSSKSVTITSNTTTTVTPDTGYDGLSSVEVITNVAPDLSNIFGGTYTEGVNAGSSYGRLSFVFKNIKLLPTLPISGTSMSHMFASCENLITAPALDTSNINMMDFAFYGCSSLVNLPIYNTANVTQMNNMVKNCSALSDDSLNNVLYMCSHASSYYSYTKTLKAIGMDETQVTRCQNLSNYQAVLDAGWTTGY